MTTRAKRREGRRIRRRRQGMPYTITIPLYSDLSDFPLVYAIAGGHRYLVGKYSAPRTSRPTLHNGRKPR